jgi:hypothetical protein
LKKRVLNLFGSDEEDQDDQPTNSNQSRKSKIRKKEISLFDSDDEDNTSLQPSASVPSPAPSLSTQQGHPYTTIPVLRNSSHSTTTTTFSVRSTHTKSTHNSPLQWTVDAAQLPQQYHTRNLGEHQIYRHPNHHPPNNHPASMAQGFPYHSGFIAPQFQSYQGLYNRPLPPTMPSMYFYQPPITQKPVHPPTSSHAQRVSPSQSTSLPSNAQRLNSTSVRDISPVSYPSQPLNPQTRSPTTSTNKTPTSIPNTIPTIPGLTWLPVYHSHKQLRHILDVTNSWEKTHLRDLHLGEDAARVHLLRLIVHLMHHASLPDLDFKNDQSLDALVQFSGKLMFLKVILTEFIQNKINLVVATQSDACKVCMFAS